jgi:hypothetical protein
MCVLHGLVSRDLGLAYVWEGHRIQKPIWITEWINIKIAIYAYDYQCKINVKYKLSYQIRCHFPSNQLTNTLPLDHGCNFSGMLYNYSAYMYIYIYIYQLRYISMRWICVNGPWLSNFESSCFFPFIEPLLKFQTSRMQQRHFFVLYQNRTNWMVRDFHRCRKHLRAWVTGERLPPISWTQYILLLVSPLPLVLG